MGSMVYGRRAIRQFERETGEKIVHASTFLTTVDHRHLGWTGERWTELEPFDGSDCGVWPPQSSCGILFGRDHEGARTQFMLGECLTCGAGPGEAHHFGCSILDMLLSWPSINPDYWPRPVHRPQWVDDPRRLARVR
jgi:hypothetical protein